MRTIRLKKGWVGPSLAIPLVGFVILAGCGKRPYVTVSSPKVITVSEWKQSNAAQEARGLLSRYLNASESDAATSQTLMFRSLSSLQGSTTRRDFISTSTGVSVRADALGDITNALTQNDIVTTNTVTQRSERLDVAGRPTNDFTSSTTTTLTSPVLEALKSPEGVALLKGILTDSGPAETFYDPPIDTLEQAMDVFQNYAAKVNNTLDGRLKMMTVTPAVDVDVTQAGAARSVLATSANRAAHYELFRLGSEVEKQLGRLAALEAEKKSLQSQIKEFDAKLKTPNAVLADSKLQITAANNAIAAQAQRLSSMLTKRDMAETAATSGVTTELEVKASLHSKEQLKLAQILVNEAQAELQSLKQQLAVAEKTKSATDTLIAAIETKKAEAEKKVTSIAELKTSVSGQLKAAEAALKAHASDNAAKIAAFREAAATLAAHDVKSENTYSIDDIGLRRIADTSSTPRWRTCRRRGFGSKRSSRNGEA